VAYELRDFFDRQPVPAEDRHERVQRRRLGIARAALADRLDAVVIDTNHPWDVAGVALARAAVAHVTDIDGSPHSLSGHDLLTTTPQIHDATVAALASARSTGRSRAPKPKSAPDQRIDSTEAWGI
jgi:hypothetical protein